MEINRIRIDKSAYDPKSLYSKLKAEEQLKDMTDNNTEKNSDCVVEEVDCASSLTRLTSMEYKYIVQSKPVRKKLKTEGNGNAVKNAGSKEAGVQAKVKKENSSQAKDRVKEGSTNSTKDSREDTYKGNANRTNTDKTNTNKTNTNKTNTNKTNTNKTNTNKTNINKTNTNKSDTNKTNTGKASTNKGNSNNSNTGKGNTNKTNSNKGNFNKGNSNTGNSNKSNSNKGNSYKSNSNKTNNSISHMGKENGSRVNTEKSSTVKSNVVNETKNKEVQDKMEKIENINKEAIVEEEKCIIEEVDCKLSLISIGYEDKDEPDVNEPSKKEPDIKELDNKKPSKKEPDIKELDNKEPREKEPDIKELDNKEPREKEPDIKEPDRKENNAEESDNLSQKNITYSAAVQKAVNLVKSKEEQKEPDIVRYFSASIIDKVLEYPGDKTVTETAAENIEENSKQEGNRQNEDDLKEKQQADTNLEQKKYENKKEAKENKKNDRKILPFNSIHKENILGYVSILALLGLFGIFTEYKTCLGFWAFLYYIRYFFVQPGEIFKAIITKAAAYAFITDITASLLFIILYLIFQNIPVIIVGMTMGMIVSILVFTVILGIYEKRINSNKMR
ncbi:DUF3796 domain-containing protein [Anaerocolumna sedimenticola]|uniref:DUF3796 domain-containing protein n=1 Tax=Anaerocolumna sedimenticola TaxID=2696063 RepID=A0A6P1TPK6_9FIRM|nr:DUF3796 domain-containing protein [Anaerocolumna sedimenticola]QHQ63190.1 DUF3796 domain-containing protein [Anaerocolumna sedimenticola]